nr:hypothetical protein [Sicyoidochytrium minutum DNA virus]
MAQKKDDDFMDLIGDTIMELATEEVVQRLNRHLEKETASARYRRMLTHWRDLVTIFIIVENAMFFYAYEICRCAENYFWNYSTFFMVSHIVFFVLFLYILLRWTMAKICG